MARILIKDVADAVFDEMQSAYVTGDDSQWVDVRRVSNADQTTWELCTGLSDYDQWHGDACGASAFNAVEEPSRRAARKLAQDLIGQVQDQLAQ